MTVDYGGGRRKRKALGLLVLIAAAVVLVVGFIAIGWLRHRPADIRTAQLWAISGPPCPAVSRPVFEAQPDPIRYRFDNDGITFSRAHGNVLCEDVVDNGGRGFSRFTECQFTAPGALQVTTSAGDFYYLLPYGAATVSVKNDRPACVRGGWFKGRG